MTEPRQSADYALADWFDVHRQMFLDTAEAAGYEEAYDWLVRCATDPDYGLQIDGHEFTPRDVTDHGWPAYDCAICGKRKSEHSDGLAAGKDLGDSGMGQPRRLGDGAER